MYRELNHLLNGKDSSDLHFHLLYQEYNSFESHLSWLLAVHTPRFFCCSYWTIGFLWDGFFPSCEVQLLQSIFGDMKHVYCLSLAYCPWLCALNLFLGPVYSSPSQPWPMWKPLSRVQSCQSIPPPKLSVSEVYFSTHWVIYFPLKSKC